MSAGKMGMAECGLCGRSQTAHLTSRNSREVRAIKRTLLLLLLRDKFDWYSNCASRGGKSGITMCHKTVKVLGEETDD